MAAPAATASAAAAAATLRLIPSHPVSHSLPRHHSQCHQQLQCRPPLVPDHALALEHKHKHKHQHTCPLAQAQACAVNSEGQKGRRRRAAAAALRRLAEATHGDDDGGGEHEREPEGEHASWSPHSSLSSSSSPPHAAPAAVFCIPLLSAALVLLPPLHLSVAHPAAATEAAAEAVAGKVTPLEISSSSSSSGGGNGDAGGSASPGKSLADSIKRFLDSEETVESGKRYPKEYVKSVRDVAGRLRESLEDESAANSTQFREKAEAAKDAIRRYLQSWRGKQVPGAEQTNDALERALRELSTFYSRNGPRATMPSSLKTTILGYLQAAEDAL